MSPCHIKWFILYSSYLIDWVTWSISHGKNTSCESVLLLLSIECISIVMITFPFSQHYLYLQNWKFFVVKDSAYCLYKSSRPEIHLFDNGLKLISIRPTYTEYLIIWISKLKFLNQWTFMVINSLDKSQIHPVEVKLQDYHDDKSSEICTRNLRMTPRTTSFQVIPHETELFHWRQE